LIILVAIFVEPLALHAGYILNAGESLQTIDRHHPQHDDEEVGGWG
jgi:hypothetical protein